MFRELLTERFACRAPGLHCLVQGFRLLGCTFNRKDLPFYGTMSRNHNKEPEKKVGTVLRNYVQKPQKGNPQKSRFFRLQVEFWSRQFHCFKSEGLEEVRFRALGLGFRVLGFGLRAIRLGMRAQSLGFRFLGFRDALALKA